MYHSASAWHGTRVPGSGTVNLNYKTAKLYCTADAWHIFIIGCTPFRHRAATLTPAALTRELGSLGPRANFESKQKVSPGSLHLNTC